MYMMSILYTAAGNWFTLFKVLTFNVTMLTVFLHLSNFVLSLSSVADFFNNEARVPTSAEYASFLLVQRAMWFAHMV